METTISFLNQTFADDNMTMSTVADDNATVLSNVTTQRPVPRTPPPVGHYGDIRIQLWKILPPIIMTWGITGNILSIIILFRIARKTSLTSTTIYLVTLAISDTTILLCGPLRNWIKEIWKKDVRYYSNASCKSQLFFTYFSIHVSSWILVAITMERVASVVFPHKVKVGCTPRNAGITVLIILVVLGGLSLVHPIIQGLETARGNIRCSPTTEEYLKFRDDIYLWIDFFLSFGLPFLFLVIGNAIIIYRLNQSKLKQKKMNVSRGDGKQSGRDMRSLSILLVSLSVIFLLTMTPFNVFAVFYPYRFEQILEIKDPYKQWYDYQYLIYQHAVVNLVGYTNASFNFILYVLTGTKFRKEFLDMFKCAAIRKKFTTVTSHMTSSSSAGTKQMSLSASDITSKKNSEVHSETNHSMTSGNGATPHSDEKFVEETEMKELKTDSIQDSKTNQGFDKGHEEYIDQNKDKNKDEVPPSIDENEDVMKDIRLDDSDESGTNKGFDKDNEKDFIQNKEIP